MDDLINRNDLVKELQRIIDMKHIYLSSYGDKKSYIEGWDTCADILSHFLMRIPPVDISNIQVKQVAKITNITLTSFPPQEAYICNNCGNRLEKVDVYCSHCGAKLEWNGM
jgi:hypothetical protein